MLKGLLKGSPLGCLSYFYEMKLLYVLLFLCACLGCSSDHRDPKVKELFEQGYSALIGRDYAQAALYLSEVVSLDSSYLEARNNYAVALWNLSDQDKAWDQIRFILHQSPDFKDALINSYAWNIEIGNHEEAYQVADQLYAQFPDSIRFLTWRAQAALQSMSFEQALQDFNLLVTLEEKNYTHWVNRALVFLQTGNFTSSESDLMQALKLKSFEPLILNNLSMVCLYAQKNELAYEHSKSARRIDPESSDSKIVGSLCAFMNDQAEEGFQLLGDTAQYTIEQKPFLYRNLGVYHLRKNNQELAYRFFQDALSGTEYPDFANYFTAQLALKNADTTAACIFLEESSKRFEWDASTQKANYCKP